MTYAQQMKKLTEMVNQFTEMALNDKKLALSILDRLGITEDVVKKKSNAKRRKK